MPTYMRYAVAFIVSFGSFGNSTLTYRIFTLISCFGPAAT